MENKAVLYINYTYLLITDQRLRKTSFAKKSQ